MLRTLLPLTLLTASVAAQAGQPVPAPGAVVIDLGLSISWGPALPEALAKTEWLLPGPVTEPKWTLFVCTNAALLEGQRGCLEDLQKRFGERGARIAVVLRSADAKALAAKKPPFAVGALDEATQGLVVGPTGSCWFAAGAQTPVFAAVDGAADLLAAAADGKDLGQLQMALLQLESLLANAADGGDFRAPAAQLVALVPHSGRARAT